MKIRNQGFTLIELMITVVIVSILAAIAIPNYAQYVRNTRRTEAKSALLTVATSLEKYLLQNNRYTTTLGDLSATGELDLSTGITADGNYTVTILEPGDATITSSNAWAVRAVYVTGSSQSSDTDCKIFEYYLSGVKLARADDGTHTDETCWN